MRLIAIIAATVILQACAGARLQQRRAMTGGELGQILAALPSVSAATRIQLFDRSFAAAPFELLEQLYKQTSTPHPYENEVWDCDKIARAAAHEVSLAWAKRGERQALAHGCIFGILPRDGDNRGTGPHALNWFVDDQGRFWLRGAIERSVLNPSAIEGMKEIWLITTG